MSLSSLSKHKDIGLLIIRVIVGASFIFHGYPKVTGGVDTWTQVGSAMGIFGISFGHVVFGAIAAFSEFLGGALLLIGFQARWASLFLCLTMTVAALMHYLGGDGFGAYSHPMEIGAVFLGLIFIGPGKYSIDKK